MSTDIQTLLRQAKESRFWGSIEVKFQDGNAVMVNKTETIKMNEGTTECLGDRLREENVVEPKI